MHIIEQLVVRLRADSDVTAIVGNRIYADHPTQDTSKPAIEIYNISDDQEQTVDMCTITAGMMVVQVNCIGTTRSQAYDISRAVRRGILHFTSNDSEQSIQDVNVASGSRWDRLRPQDGSDSYGYEYQDDYNIPYTFTL